MKKRILLLTAVMALFAFNSVAQRITDASVVLNYPTNGVTIYDGIPLTQQINLTIKNHGPDTIKVGDTILFGLHIGGSAFGGTSFSDDTKAIYPDSVITYYYSSGHYFDFPQSWIGTSKLFCAYIQIINRGQLISLIDNNQANDTSCTSVNIEGHPSSIGELNDIVASKITTYPNPASNLVNVSFILEKNEPVVIKLSDIQGKVVSSVQENNVPLGEFKTSFDVSGLKNGVYLFEIKVGNHSKVEKIIVAH